MTPPTTTASALTKWWQRLDKLYKMVQTPLVQEEIKAIQKMIYYPTYHVSSSATLSLPTQ